MSAENTEIDNSLPPGARLDAEQREHEKRVEAGKKAAKTRAQNALNNSTTDSSDA